jgi:hypothetical protein
MSSRSHNLRTCRCDDCSYQRGRHEARISLGYDDWGETVARRDPYSRWLCFYYPCSLHARQVRIAAGPDMRAERAARDRTLTVSTGLSVDSGKVTLAPDAICRGCRIAECSPIGGGPFKDGLCRFCIQLVPAAAPGVAGRTARARRLRAHDEVAFVLVIIVMGLIMMASLL